jgi:hypothetical protein
MPLNTPQLKQDIKDLTEELFNNTGNLNPAQSREKYADDLSAAIERYVKTGLVTVATTGTAAAQTGTGNIT